METENKRLRGAANQAVRQRNYRRARDRALVRLAHLYPDTYKQLLEMEKIADEKQGKNWISIDGSTVLSMGVHTRATGADNLAHTNNEGTNQSNDGGEG